jgi:CyaY protein
MNKEMNDSQYHILVDEVLLGLEEALDEIEVDIDYESASSILTLTFENGTKIIINKQPPLHQIDERTDVEFWSFMDEAASKQALQAVSLSMHKP